MIAIIAEKPSVGHEIARVIGADQKGEGYLHGNGYAVCWASGHLVGLAIPADYGLPARIPQPELPFIPDPFRLVIRRREGERPKDNPSETVSRHREGVGASKYAVYRENKDSTMRRQEGEGAKDNSSDSRARRQLKVIGKLFDECESIIVATDAGREGELIFRHIYDFLGCKKPFQRLWVSSLTDEALREGLDNLRPGSDYDGLFRAGDARAKADWLVGINASQALATATGDGNNSLGRVQTPTLAMVCRRFVERRHFEAKPFWRLQITVEKDGRLIQVPDDGSFSEQSVAQLTYEHLQTQSHAQVMDIERRNLNQLPPLLYDLTTLQKDANVHHGLTAQQTLDAAQRLYEARLISYPRTGSRYIPLDVAGSIYPLLEKILANKELTFEIGIKELSIGSIDDSKVTDHHALIVTGNTPGELKEHERIVYRLIAGRMLEAFSPDCVKQSTVVRLSCGGIVFALRQQRVVEPGWRGVFDRKSDMGEGELSDQEATMPEFVKKEHLPMAGCNMSEHKTKPKPLYTEATLLEAMENAGRDLPETGQRDILRHCGIGTPATRAAIIETLIEREYIERANRNLIPTERGLHLWEAVHTLQVADVSLTASWEQQLALVERGELGTEEFQSGIIKYVQELTAEILAIHLPEGAWGGYPCPKCKVGRVILRARSARCNNPACGLAVYRTIRGHKLTAEQVGQLLSTGKTELIKGFRSAKGSTFDAYVVFDKKAADGKVSGGSVSYTVQFEFPKEREAGKKFPNGRKPDKRASKGKEPSTHLSKRPKKESPKEG